MTEEEDDQTPEIAVQRKARRDSRRVTAETRTDIQGLIGGGRPLPERGRAYFQAGAGPPLRHLRRHTPAETAAEAGAPHAPALPHAEGVALVSGDERPATLP